MSANQTNVKTEVYNFLKSKGYDPKLLSTSGKQVPVENEAEVIGFNFRKGDQDYGAIYCSLDNSGVFTIYVTDEVRNSANSGDEDDLSWTELIETLRKLTFGKVSKFEVDPIGNLEHDMAKREHTKKLEESYHPINKKASYSDNIPTVKIHIQHNRALEEGEKRYHNIERIFVENQLGERFLLDTKKPGLARVYARHIAEGGKVNDDRWNHIGSLCEEYSKMAGFVRATRNNQFNESTQKLVNEGINHYQSLRETLHKLTGKKGYNTYFESYTPKLMEDEESADLSEMFMSNSLDPRIECVMPILSKLSKNINENTIAEVSELEEWADNIIEATDIPVDDKKLVPIGKTVDSTGKEIVGKATKTLPSKMPEKVKRKPSSSFDESRDDEEEELIGGRYTQDQWDRMVNNVKKLAHKQQKEKMEKTQSDNTQSSAEQPSDLSRIRRLSGLE